MIPNTDEEAEVRAGGGTSEAVVDEEQRGETARRKWRK